MKEAKQEQLVNTRRNQILDAATKLFAAKGFHPTTIKDVAREAGLADGTIYIYFPNKPALLLGIMDRLTAAARQNVDLSQLTTMDLQQLVRAFVQYPLTVFEAGNFELFRVIVAEIMVNQELRERYYQQLFEPMTSMAEQYFAQWAEQNSVAPVHTKLLMHTISSIVLGLIMQRIMGDTTLEVAWDQLPDYVSDLLSNGIRSNQS